MKRIRILCALAWLLCLGSEAHAEGNCPSGYYPIGGSATAGCAPIPGNGNGGVSGGGGPEWQPFSAPAPIWEDRWGAIALDEQRGVLGTVTGLPNEQAAKQAAMDDCKAKGGSDCKLMNSYVNGCTAFTTSDTRYNTVAKATRDQAISTGMRICADAGDKNCRTYYSACSPPVRIR